VNDQDVREHTAITNYCVSGHHAEKGCNFCVAAVFLLLQVIAEHPADDAHGAGYGCTLLRQFVSRGADVHKLMAVGSPDPKSQEFGPPPDMFEHVQPEARLQAEQTWLDGMFDITHDIHNARDFVGSHVSFSLSAWRDSLRTLAPPTNSDHALSPLAPFGSRVVQVAVAGVCFGMYSKASGHGNPVGWSSCPIVRVNRKNKSCSVQWYRDMSPVAIQTASLPEANIWYVGSASHRECMHLIGSASENQKSQLSFYVWFSSPHPIIVFGLFDSSICSAP
jgi:hypothetical protein